MKKNMMSNFGSICSRISKEQQCKLWQLRAELIAAKTKAATSKKEVA